jgi:hypothetical protein
MGPAAAGLAPSNSDNTSSPWSFQSNVAVTTTDAKQTFPCTCNACKDHVKHSTGTQLHPRNQATNPKERSFFSYVKNLEEKKKKKQLIAHTSLQSLLRKLTALAI